MVKENRLNTKPMDAHWTRTGSTRTWAREIRGGKTEPISFHESVCCCYLFFFFSPSSRRECVHFLRVEFVLVIHVSNFVRTPRVSCGGARTLRCRSNAAECKHAMATLLLNGWINSAQKQRLEGEKLWFILAICVWRVCLILHAGCQCLYAARTCERTWMLRLR